MSDDLRPTLPFDDEADRPVGFRLTAAARRALDPADVPALRVVRTADVPDASAPQDPDDLRPAQARALRRSGMRTATIAAAMGLDPAIVEAWTEDVAPRRGRAARTAAVRGGRGRADAGRAAAARRRFAGQEAAVGAGLAVAIARIDADGDAVTLTDERPELVAAAFGALRAETPFTDGAVRVAARGGSALAGDRVRADLVTRLGVGADRIVVGRWQGAPAADALELSIRIADRRVVRTVDAWALAAVAATTAATTSDVLGAAR